MGEPLALWRNSLSLAAAEMRPPFSFAEMPMRPDIINLRGVVVVAIVVVIVVLMIYFFAGNSTPTAIP